MRTSKPRFVNYFVEIKYFTVELAFPGSPSIWRHDVAELPTFFEASIARIKQPNSGGNASPYFEVKKKKHGLFKSTENHLLACSLHLHLNAPLIRFKKHLHLTWFQSFLRNAFFLGFFFLLRDGRLLEVHMPATWHGIFNMHMLIEVSRILEGFICTPRGMVVEVRCPRRDLPTEEKKTTKENIKRKSRQWLQAKNSKRHNFTDT